MIAAEHDRQRAGVERGARHRVDTAAHGGDVLDVLLAGVTFARELANGRRHVALIHRGAAERGNPLAQAGNPQRRRPHVHPAPSAAEVEGRADQMNGLHRGLATRRCCA